MLNLSTIDALQQIVGNKNIITDPLSRIMTDSIIVKKAMPELVPILDEIQ